MNNLPDPYGHFDIFGGRYAAETLMPALLELEVAYGKAKKDKSFAKEFDWYRREYAGRPTPLYFARRMTKALGGAKIYMANVTGRGEFVVPTPSFVKTSARSASGAPAGMTWTRGTPPASACRIAVIGMGKSFNYRVVAEGVETLEQQLFLQANLCDESQGHHFSSPLSASGFATLMESRNPGLH